jgi:hypothetical protein
MMFLMSDSHTSVVASSPVDLDKVTKNACAFCIRTSTKELKSLMIFYLMVLLLYRLSYGSSARLDILPNGRHDDP